MRNINHYQTKLDALQAAIASIAEGYNSPAVEYDEDANDWTVGSHYENVVAGYPTWTYDDGLDIPDDVETSRLLAPYESLETVSHYRYHLDTVDEWLESDDQTSLWVQWCPVESAEECEEDHTAEDTERGYCMDCEDRMVGHVYVAMTL